MTRVARTTRRRTRPRPGRSLPNRAASTRAAPEPGSEPNAGSRTALQKHVDFFDSNQDGLITFSETYDGLRRLGIDVVRSAAFAAIINGVLGPMTSRTLTLTIDTARIQRARHQSDSGVYDQHGHFSLPRFRQVFKRCDSDGTGALGAAELSRFVARNREDLAGHLGSKAEFRLLLEVAGEERKGRRVLTRERLEQFYNGSLFYTIANELRAIGSAPGRSVEI